MYVHREVVVRVSGNHRTGRRALRRRELCPARCALGVLGREYILGESKSVRRPINAPSHTQGSKGANTAHSLTHSLASWPSRHWLSWFWCERTDWCTAHKNDYEQHRIGLTARKGASSTHTHTHWVVKMARWKRGDIKQCKRLDIYAKEQKQKQ